MIIDFPRDEHIPGLRRLWQEAFGDTDRFLDAFFGVGFSLYRCYCIREGATPVAALYWFDCRWQDKRLAYIYAVATAKEYRGQGLCHKLMRCAHQILLELGYSGAVLVPAKPDLFAFYEGMGYRCFGGIREWECTAGAPLPLTELTYKEYAAARENFLPLGSVTQSGATLRFLGTYAHFYQGDGFIACTAQEDNGKLVCYELLGNRDAAPGITATLGKEKGTFRTVGNSPFAMYRSLTDDQQMPQYFAFALD